MLTHLQSGEIQEERIDFLFNEIKKIIFTHSYKYFNII